MKELLSSPHCGKVTAVTRKSVSESDFNEKPSEKFNNKVVDFSKLDSGDFAGFDVGFNAMGSTIKKAGSEEAFYTIDYVWPTSIAEMALKKGTKFFSTVSSMGADATSSFFYMKTKGQTDEKFKNLGFEKCSVFRPGLLLTERSESRPGEYIFQSIVGNLNWLIPKKWNGVEVEAVARAMKLDFEKFWIAENSKDAGYRIFENDEIIDMAYEKSKL